MCVCDIWNKYAVNYLILCILLLSLQIFAMAPHNMTGFTGELTFWPAGGRHNPGAGLHCVCVCSSLPFLTEVPGKAVARLYLCPLYSKTGFYNHSSRQTHHRITFTRTQVSLSRCLIKLGVIIRCFSEVYLPATHAGRPGDLSRAVLALA